MNLRKLNGDPYRRENYSCHRESKRCSLLKGSRGFRPAFSSRHIEVSAGPDALWDMSSRTVVEVGVVYWRRRRRENKICQITEPAGSTRTFYKSRRWPWVAYCNLNSFVLSSRIKRSIASDDRLIVCTQRRSCSCHRFLTPNSRYTNSRTRWRIILNRIVKLPICLLRDL